MVEALTTSMLTDCDALYRLFTRQNAVLTLMLDALADSNDEVSANVRFALRELMTENQCHMYALKGISGLPQ
jgi:hypothetical protein